MTTNEPPSSACTPLPEASDPVAGRCAVATGSGWVAFASVQVSKDEPPYRTANSMTLHWRTNVNENEMRGIAAEEALKAKPGFSIDAILVGIAYFPNNRDDQRRGEKL